MRRSLKIHLTLLRTPAQHEVETRHRVELDITRQNPSHISGSGKVAQKADEIRQFGVMRVVEPGHHGDSVIRVEQVGRRRVVENNAVHQWPTEHGEVLDVIAAVAVATFAEQAMRHRFVDIDLVQHRIRVLPGTCQHTRRDHQWKWETRTLLTLAVYTTTS